MCEGLSSCLLDDFHLMFLESLQVRVCEGIECILTNEKLMAPVALQSQFPNLEEVFLDGLRAFMGVIHKQETGATELLVSPSPTRAVFSSLRMLSVSYCNKMKKLGLPILQFLNLEQIEVIGCDEIEEIIEVADERGEGEREGEARSVSVDNLKKLALCELSCLSCICKAIMKCRSIERIELKNCPTLKKLPLDWMFLPLPSKKSSYGKKRKNGESQWSGKIPPTLISSKPFLHFERKMVGV